MIFKMEKNHILGPKVQSTSEVLTNKDIVFFSLLPCVNSGFKLLAQEKERERERCIDAEKKIYECFQLQ